MWARARESLHSIISRHDRISHRGVKAGALVEVISEADFIALETYRHSPTFWKAFNKRRL
jgi:hypothetical protein